MSNKFFQKVEKGFEGVLTFCRMLVLIAVLGSLAASMFMFFKGAWAIKEGIWSFTEQVSVGAQQVPEMVLHFISAIDAFLFAMILLIFSMGIYELFVSKLEPLRERTGNRSDWLRVESLDELKSYLGKVVLMILIVNFFEQAFYLKYEEALDLLYLGGGIMLVALSLYLTHGKIHIVSKDDNRKRLVSRGIELEDR